jgi:carbon monoxide dehydrogenase subunit G
MRFILVLIAGLAAAGLVRAAEPKGAGAAALRTGRPQVEVRSDPAGDGGVIVAAIDVAAPPEVVFQVVTDCDLAPKMVTSLKSCRITARDPAGRWDVREQVSKMTLLPSVRNVFRSVYDPPNHVHFHRVDGDLKIYEGDWWIEPIDGGTRVTYESRISTPFRVPGPLARWGMRMQVPQALLALRRESLARAPGAAASHGREP